MKTYKILCEQLGENATTPQDPVRVYVEGSVNLEETVSCCVSSDNDMHVSVKRWGVRDVLLPDWCSPEFWLQHRTELKWTWACLGMAAPKDLVLACFRVSTAEKLALGRLIQTKNFRSAFRKNIYDQVQAWLSAPPEQRKYPFPLSPKQMAAITDRHTALAAKQLDSSLYYSGRHI